ncbi:hypothetical protein Isop_0827 [Isosphaera pallida ATCC 43644]|uniref:Glycosyltransferase RgtA/B/C/D-like domain-containing protein n=1 Tax=Isosphaera pallida (strain ATCC 43644 / DSM 9630 / IS1B) TaxID=575540 RepID=E8R2D2_ISOPI|nr:hypothetical protein [Isosphaera pallida]ADV61417.1 hypothetical protein Isop_0827 [Isosphaera pallida ATCC 43644]
MRSRSEWARTTAILALMVGGHLIGLARTPLPAPDGLVYLRVARDFQTQPWYHVVQDTDRHPLYPALVALLQPLASRLNTAFDWDASTSTLWRISGQMVAIGGWVMIVTGLIALSRLWLGRGLALWIVAWVGLTPVFNTISHDTLADSWMVGVCVWAWWLFNTTLATQRWFNPALAFVSGWLIGVGYGFKPDAILMAALILASVWGTPRERSTWYQRGLVTITFLVGLMITCGCYALVKGAVSEKLSVRLSIGLSPMAAEKLRLKDTSPSNLLAGWTPKEETDANQENALTSTVFAALATGLRATGVPGSLAIVLGSVWFSRIHGRSHPILAQTGFGLTIITLAQSMQYERLHYLSERHAWLIGCFGVIWCAWVANHLFEQLRLARGPGIQRWCSLVCGFLLLIGFGLASRGNHLSRAAQLEAATWLQSRLVDGERVFDSRGFVLFVTQRRDYDAWHLTQALTDHHLRYLVFQRNEVEGKSNRAEAIRRVLRDRNAALVGAFDGSPPHRGGEDRSVLIYQLGRPNFAGDPITRGQEVATCGQLQPK